MFLVDVLRFTVAINFPSWRSWICSIPNTAVTVATFSIKSGGGVLFFNTLSTHCHTQNLVKNVESAVRATCRTCDESRWDHETSNQFKYLQMYSWFIPLNKILFFPNRHYNFRHFYGWVWPAWVRVRPTALCHMSPSLSLSFPAISWLYLSIKNLKRQRKAKLCLIII